GRLGRGWRGWWNSSWWRWRRSECPRFRHAGERSGNRDVTRLRPERCRCGWRLRRQRPCRQVDQHRIRMFRGGGVATTRWESNSGSFLFGFVAFGHGDVDEWEIKLAKNWLRCHWRIRGWAIKGREGPQPTDRWKQMLQRRLCQAPVWLDRRLASR